MGNGNKIKINKPEVKLFLHEDLLPSEAETPSLYNLEAEYAKTRTRKFSFILSVLLGCFAGVALLTYGLASFLQTRNEAMEVDITVFEDLNLKNLLDVVSQTQFSLEQASTEKNQLEIELATKIKQAQFERDTQLQLLDSLKMSNDAKQREIRTIHNEYESLVAKLDMEYEPLITAYEVQMDDYTKQLASYDSANVALAQQQESAINSQRQIFELEKQELISNYEKLVSDLVEDLEFAQSSQLQTQRETMSALNNQHAEELITLDPVFTDERALSIIDRLFKVQSVEELPTQDISLLPENSLSIVGQTDQAAVLPNNQDTSMQEGVAEVEISSSSEVLPLESEQNTVPLTQDKNILFSVNNFNLQLEDQNLQTKAEESLYDAGKAFSDFNYMSEIISSVPWQNSLKDFFQTISAMANNIGNDIVNATIELLQIQEKTIQEKNTIINDNEIVIDTLEEKVGSAEKVIAMQTQTLNKQEEELAQREAELKEAQRLVESLRMENNAQMVFVEEMHAQIEPLLAIKETHDHLLSSFDDRARENGDFGYVLSIDNTEKIGVYISPLYKEIIKDGMKAYVFRSSKILIGEITLYKESGVVYAIAEEGVKENLRSNDVILLELVQ